MSLEQLVVTLVGDATSYIQALGKAQAALQGFASASQQVAGVVASALAPVGSAVAAVAKQAVTTFENVLPTIAKSMTSVLNNAVTNGTKVINGLVNNVTKMTTSLVTVLANNVTKAVNNLVTTLANNVTKALTSVMTSAIGNATKLVNSLMTSLATNVTKTVNSLISNVLSSATKAANNLVNALATSVTKMVNNVVSNLATGITKAVNNLVTNLLGSVTKAVNNLVNAMMGGVTKIVNNAVGSLAGAVNNLVNSLTKAVNNLVNTLAGVVTRVFANVAKSVTSVINNLVNNLTKAVNNVVTALANSVTKVVTTLSGNVTKIVNNLLNNMTKVLNNLVTNATRVVTSVVSAVGRVASTVVSSVGKAVSGVVRDVIKGAGSMASAILTGPFKAIGSFGSRLGEMAGAFQRMRRSMAVPVFSFGEGNLDAYREFNQKITEATSIMGDLDVATQKSMEGMAKSLSMTGKQSAAELAEAFYFLTSAGMDVQQSMRALPAVQAFATAGNFDLSKATTIATDSMLALGMGSKDASDNLSDLIRVTDVLVKADSIANASVYQFGVALTHQAGAAAKSFGKDLEETVAVLAAFSAQGIKAELAGNTFSRLLRVLSYSAVKHAAAYKKLNVQVYDANGTMRNTADIVQNLEQVLGPMSDELRTATLKSLGFEIRLQQAVLPLLGTSEAIREYERRLRQADKTTKDVAQKQLQSFNNQLQMVKNTVNVLAIELGELLAPAVLTVAEVFKEFVLWVQNLSPEVKTAVLTFTAVAAGLTTLTAALVTAAAAVAFFVGSVGWIAGPIVVGIIMAAAATARWVQDVGGLTKAFEILRQKVNELWVWLKPVRQALAGLAGTAWESFQRAFFMMVDLAKRAWNWITGGGEVAWETLRSQAVDAILYMEFAVKNFEKAFELAWAAIKYYSASGVKWVLDHIYNAFQGPTLGKVFMWFSNTWTNMWLAAANVVLDVMTQAFNKLGRVVFKFFTATSVDDFKKALDEINTIGKVEGTNIKFTLGGLDIGGAKKDVDDMVKKLKDEFDKLNGSFQGDFNKFRDKRLAEMAAEAIKKGQQLEEEILPKSTNKVRGRGWGLGKDLGEAIGDGMRSAIPSIENVLFGSAEAARRIQAFKDSVRGVGEDEELVPWGEAKHPKKKDPVPKAVPLASSDTDRPNSRVEKVLVDIREILSGESKKPEVKIRPANLTA